MKHRISERAKQKKRPSNIVSGMTVAFIALKTENYPHAFECYICVLWHSFWSMHLSFFWSCCWIYFVIFKSFQATHFYCLFSQNIYFHRKSSDKNNEWGATVFRAGQNVLLLSQEVKYLTALLGDMHLRCERRKNGRCICMNCRCFMNGRVRRPPTKLWAGRKVSTTIWLTMFNVYFSWTCVFCY